MCLSRTGTCVLLMFIFRPASFLCSSRERVRLSTYFISFGNCANLLIKKKKKGLKFSFSLNLIINYLYQTIMVQLCVELLKLGGECGGVINWSC